MNSQILVSPSKPILVQTGAIGWNGFRGSRRDRLEIFAEILRLCSNKKSKTRIMYANGLNYVQLQDYLGRLMSCGLLLSVNGRYITTEKGHVFLDCFMGIQNLLENIK